MRAAFFALALLSCHKKVADPAAAEGVLDCAQVAQKGADGAVDECDQRACASCVDFCGAECVLERSTDAAGGPQQYLCPGIGAFTVYDSCPTWGQDTPAEGSE